METQSNEIPEEIPEGKSVYIESVKKRRSSIRRSVNGGYSSAFKVACSTLSSLPPDKKKRHITELCINQTFDDLKNSVVSEEEYNVIIKFEESFRKRQEELLAKIENCDADTVHREETQIQKYINQLKVEKECWKAEYKQRKENFLKAKKLLKSVLKGDITITPDQKSKLKAADLKLLNDIPDFSQWKEKADTLLQRHRICIIHLEKYFKQVDHALANNCDLDAVLDRIAPTFDPSNL